jgi:hypothetical protein
MQSEEEGHDEGTELWVIMSRPQDNGITLSNASKTPQPSQFPTDTCQPRALSISPVPTPDLIFSRTSLTLLIHRPLVS